MNKERDLSRLEVIPKLPDYFKPERGEPVPADLVGATIVQVGTFAEPYTVEGGGLVIDYQTAGGEVRRAVLACSECGMWQVSSRG